MSPSKLRRHASLPLIERPKVAGTSRGFSRHPSELSVLRTAICAPGQIDAKIRRDAPGRVVITSDAVRQNTASDILW